MFDRACPSDTLALAHYDGAVVAFNDGWRADIRACADDAASSISLEPWELTGERQVLNAGSLRLGPDLEYELTHGELHTIVFHGAGEVVEARFDAHFVTADGSSAVTVAGGTVRACVLPRYASPWDEGLGECGATLPCPDVELPCNDQVCERDRCVIVPSPEAVGAPLPEQLQRSGDCHRLVCGEHGAIELEHAPEDLPDDGNPCTIGWCHPDGFTGSDAAPAGAPCADGRGACGDDGACVVP